MGKSSIQIECGSLFSSHSHSLTYILSSPSIPFPSYKGKSLYGTLTLYTEEHDKMVPILSRFQKEVYYTCV